MSRKSDLAIAFSNARDALVRVAYAIVGGYSEAEDVDVVSGRWLRLVGADEAEPTL